MLNTFRQFFKWLQNNLILLAVYFPENPNNFEPEVAIEPPNDAQQFCFVYFCLSDDCLRRLKDESCRANKP